MMMWSKVTKAAVSTNSAENAMVGVSLMCLTGKHCQRPQPIQLTPPASIMCYELMLQTVGSRITLMTMTDTDITAGAELP